MYYYSETNVTIRGEVVFKLYRYIRNKTKFQIEKIIQAIFENWIKTFKNVVLLLILSCKTFYS